MGLDCFWQMPEDEEHPEFDRELQLTGGAVSGHGERSFRGKVYREFVKLISGKDLREGLSEQQVKQVANKLNHTEWNGVFQGGYHGFSDKQEFEDFKTMFRRYAEKNASLASW